MSRKVLFLCTGNSARSQMAAGLLEHYASDRFEVYSAGTEPKSEVFPPVVAAMREIGIDLSNAKPKSLKEYLGHIHFDEIVVVCGDAEQRCPAIFMNRKITFWPFDDPAAVEGTAEHILAETRRIREEIAATLREWLQLQPETDATARV